MLTYEKLIGFRAPEATATYAAKDVMLYALAVGAGAGMPSHEALPFVYEKGLKPLASFYNILCWPTNAWLYELGIDMRRLVHGSERLEILEPLSAEGSVVVRYRIGRVEDRGASKGLIVDIVAQVHAAVDDRLLARATTSVFCMGDGGLADAPKVERVATPGSPDRAPDRTIEVPTRADQAALYRLCGDMNPIHIDPDAARGLGLETPLLHGLCTLGASFHALARAFPAIADGRVSGLEAKFSAPVYPGETLLVDIWDEGREVRFSTRVGSDRVVLKGGRVTIRA